MNGVFITFEGCEGVGKSTQLELLKNYLKKTNQDAYFTREPGGTECAETIRKILLSKDVMLSPTVEAYLFATSRADHVERIIKPMLKQGKVVVCDRFIGSSLAYQGFARGLGVNKVNEINKHAMDGLTIDCTVFIDMNPLNSWRKQKGTIIKDDRMENESDGFHQSVYDGFKKIYSDDKNVIMIVPKSDKNETHNLIVNALKERGLIN